MATYDYRSSAGWKYNVLPIEQVIITHISDTIKFDYILSSSNYTINPITRGRDANGNIIKIIGYTYNVNIDILFDEMNVITRDLYLGFLGKKVTLNLHLSSINAVGTNVWRLIEFPRASMNISINKDDKQPVLTMNFSGTLDTNEIDNNGIFLNWVSSEPA